MGNMDMLIAAHSVAAGGVLVTNDKAFYNVKHHLILEVGHNHSSMNDVNTSA